MDKTTTYREADNNDLETAQNTIVPAADTIEGRRTSTHHRLSSVSGAPAITDKIKYVHDV